LLPKCSNFISNLIISPAASDKNKTNVYVPPEKWMFSLKRFVCVRKKPYQAGTNLLGCHTPRQPFSSKSANFFRYLCRRKRRNV
jgi:hypothetical protein